MPRKAKKIEEKEVVEAAVVSASSNTNTKREFKYERLSVSMLNTFRQCKKKFYHNYVEGIKGPQEDHFTLGLAVHKALETANLSLKEKPRKLAAPEIEYYVQVFRDDAAKRKIDDPALLTDGEDMVRAELIRINNLESPEKILSAEMNFTLVTPEGVTIHGFIDKIVEQDEETIKIGDYKTSQQALSWEEAKSDFQLSMYDLALSMLYPNYKNRILELNYLRLDDLVTSSRTAVQQKNFRKQLLAFHRAIIDFLANTKEAPKGDLNSYCHTCPYRGMCNEYLEKQKTLLPEAPNPSEITDQTFVSIWERVNLIIKAAEDWKEMLKVWAGTRLAEDPYAEITDGEKEMYTLSKSRRDYDLTKVLKLIPVEDLLGTKTGEPLVNLKSKELKNYLEAPNNKKLKNKVEKFVQIKFNAPEIRIRKKK